MSILDDFRRVTKSRPCPVCDHPDWCMVSRDDPPSRAICARVESKHRWGDAGWLHVLRSDGRPWVRARKVVIPMPSQLRHHGALAAACRDRARPDAVARLATQLGVTAESLDRLGIGWDGRNWTFPMCDADGLVRGIRLRTPGGRKFTVGGGKHGLHIPAGLCGRGPLLLPEGPTDTAAGLDLRFDAVGRPSCRGCARLIVEFIKRHRPETVVVVADADAPGRAGAAELAAVLACYWRDVRVIEPPVKDLREWLKAGATAADVNDAIEAAEPVRVRVRAIARRA